MKTGDKKRVLDRFYLREEYEVVSSFDPCA